MDNVFDQVEKNIDNLVINNADWTASATKEALDAARKGNLVLNFYDKRVPDEWLSNIRGKKVLCLAGAGGLQAPILACAGADVTVVDISDKMPWCSKAYDDSDWIEYGHTMEEYLGGLLKSGFVINGYKECQRAKRLLLCLASLDRAKGSRKKCASRK